MKYEHVDLPINLHEGEPWFLIRGQDAFAAEAVRGYAALLEAARAVAVRVPAGKDTEELRHRAVDLRLAADDVRSLATTIDEWQHDNGDKVKLPD